MWGGVGVMASPREDTLDAVTCFLCSSANVRMSSPPPSSYRSVCGNHASGGPPHQTSQHLTSPTSYSTLQPFSPVLPASCQKRWTCRRTRPPGGSKAAAKPGKPSREDGGRDCCGELEAVLLSGLQHA